jgi:hypothetical protein
MSPELREIACSDTRDCAPWPQVPFQPRRCFAFIREIARYVPRASRFCVLRRARPHPPRRPCARSLHRQRRRRAATSPRSIGEHHNGTPATPHVASVPASCSRLHSTRARPSRGWPAVPSLSGCGQRSSLRMPIFSLGAGRQGHDALLCPLLRMCAAARCHARRWRELPLPHPDPNRRAHSNETAFNGCR